MISPTVLEFFTFKSSDNLIVKREPLPDNANPG